MKKEDREARLGAFVLFGLVLAMTMVGLRQDAYENGFNKGTRQEQSLSIADPTKDLYFRPIGPQLTSKQVANARNYNEALLRIKQEG